MTGASQFPDYPVRKLGLPAEEKKQELEKNKDHSYLKELLDKTMEELKDGPQDFII